MAEGLHLLPFSYLQIVSVTSYTFIMNPWLFPPQTPSFFSVIVLNVRRAIKEKPKTKYFMQNAGGKQYVQKISSDKSDFFRNKSNLL